MEVLAEEIEEGGHVIAAESDEAGVSFPQKIKKGRRQPSGVPAFHGPGVIARNLLQETAQ